MKKATTPTEGSEWAVEAVAVRKAYPSPAGAVEALRGVELQVAPGEFVAIMGPSGCGKSTLLHLLGGLDRPTSGQVRVGGRELSGLSESALAGLRRSHIGFVFQSYNLVPNLTVAGNVDLPGALAGRRRAEVAARRNELLEILGLGDKLNRGPAELSGGEQQRVALARALINEPAVLLADEPTGNLDSKSGAEVLELIHAFHHRGQAIVLVTHDHRVAATSQRVVAMRDGRVVDEAVMTGRTQARAQDARRLVSLGNDL
ncbi:MAG TPA: ABC transporter ATP-binding protein [Acidimicrobiales bacterium]|jgi:putative ABC transport system ATP-binding protein|nr:ABC transporter ATP-binding protein [Acidimicrobiales bacterium]